MNCFVKRYCSSRNTASPEASYPGRGALRVMIMRHGSEPNDMRTDNEPPKKGTARAMRYFPQDELDEIRDEVRFGASITDIAVRLWIPTDELARLLQLRIRTAQRNAIEQSEPFVELIQQVRLREKPKYLLTDEGLDLIDDGLEASDRKMIAECEEHIRYIHAKAMAGMQ